MKGGITQSRFEKTQQTNLNKQNISNTNKLNQNNKQVDKKPINQNIQNNQQKIKTNKNEMIDNNNNKTNNNNIYSNSKTNIPDNKIKNISSNVISASSQNTTQQKYGSQSSLHNNSKTNFNNEGNIVKNNESENIKNQPNINKNKTDILKSTSIISTVNSNVSNEKTNPIKDTSTIPSGNLSSHEKISNEKNEINKKEETQISPMQNISTILSVDSSIMKSSLKEKIENDKPELNKPEIKETPTISSSINTNKLIETSSSKQPESEIDFQKSDLFKSTMPIQNRPFISSPTKYYSSDVTDISHNQKGLSNLGNTCFMNTCLQNIIHTTPFINRLLQVKKTINSSLNLTNKFYKLCLEQTQGYSSSSYSSYSSYSYYSSYSSYSSSLSQFKSAFGANHESFSGYPQHDTQEFCRYLLEDISKELNTAKDTNFYKEIKTSGKSKIEINKEFDEVFRLKENSIIVDTFYSQLINEFICQGKGEYCGCKDYSCQKLLDFPLLFPKPKSTSSYSYSYSYSYSNSRNDSYTLDDLLELFFAKETIDFETKCEKCGKKAEHEKNMKISCMPEILILSLQRISRYSSKNESYVKFPEELDLAKYADNDCISNTPTKYVLYGIGNHSGSFSFGHYYAYIKIKNQWYEFNDSRVSQKYDINFSSSTAYVLFYQRIDTL